MCMAKWWYGRGCTTIRMRTKPTAEQVQALPISAEFRQIIDTLPAFVWCAAPDGSIEFLNQRGLDYTGFKLADIKGWSWKDTNILHPNDVEGLFESWQAIVASGLEGEIQARMRRRDGEYRWFLFRVTPLFDGAGQLVAWWGVDVEIDERKRAEDRLREALTEAQAVKDQFELVIDTIPGLVWSSLPDGRIDFLNQRWREYTGLSLAEANDWGWRVAIHPDDLPGLERYWRSILASGQPGEYEARLRRFDGTYRWFLFRGMPLYNAAGILVKWYGQNTDIEDRKRAEALLAGEKRLLEMMARSDALPLILEALCALVEDVTPGCLCGILLVDSTGTHLHHGAAPSLPPSYNDAIHGRPIDPEAGPCGMAAFLKEQVIAVDVACDARWDAHEWGALALAHGLRACWSTPITSSEGVVLGTFALYWRQPSGPEAEHRNIIERMTHLAAVAIERGRTAAALQESEERLHVMADATPEVIWLTALHPENVLYASPSFERVWGLPVADLYQNPRLWTETIHPDDRSRVIDTFTRWISRDGVDEYDIEFRIVQPTGALRWVHERGVVIVDASGAPYRVSGISTDITDRKRSEDALNEVRSDLAHVARVATLGEMTAAIAHEINQPLGAIVNNANAGLRWLAAGKVHEALESGRLVVEDGHRASEILARIRAMVQKSPPHKQWIDINDALSEVLTLVGSQAERHHVSIDSSLSDDMPPVWADRVQVQQVILNLVMNAIEAMADTPDGLRRIAVGSSLVGDTTVHVSVRDHGSGVSPEECDRLFEAFHSTKPNGLGMGLAISRGIVQAHHGRLWASANADRGATFQFTLPVSAGDRS